MKLTLSANIRACSLIRSVEDWKTWQLLIVPMATSPFLAALHEVE